jgi:hypothetical protein
VGADDNSERSGVWRSLQVLSVRPILSGPLARKLCTGKLVSGDLSWILGFLHEKSKCFPSRSTDGFIIAIGGSNLASLGPGLQKRKEKAVLTGNKED